jgi:hypothetical protein
MNKEYILEEIKRTAEENGGIPLGRQRFTNETGIKITDWQGKYWAKWSDALIEAGYQPNKLQPAYDESWIIEQVISFIREIGKFPSPLELRLKAHQSSSFPNDNTIRSRLGNVSEMANKIKGYCEGKPEYLDVLNICKEKVASRLEEISRPYSQKSNIEFGYVYLMKSGRYYKIGKTGDIGRRKYDLGLILPEKPGLIHTIQTDDPAGIEAYWHNRFRDKRKEGEWFDLSKDDISAFKRRKFM